MFRRLCPWQGNKQAPREQSRREWRQRGLWWAQEWAAGGRGRGWDVLGGEGGGGGWGWGGFRVKEMLTDTINVICLLPREADDSRDWPFVPSTFSLLDLPWAKKSRNSFVRSGRKLSHAFWLCDQASSRPLLSCITLHPWSMARFESGRPSVPSIPARHSEETRSDSQHPGWQMGD